MLVGRVREPRSLQDVRFYEFLVIQLCVTALEATSPFHYRFVPFVSNITCIT